jgi:ATP adenylyltransferase
MEAWNQSRKRGDSVTHQQPWQPGKLWSRLKAQTQYALQTGALQSIETDYQFIEQAGIPFLVRILNNLTRKDVARQRQRQQEKAVGQSVNPFLPYEIDLYVMDLSETHVCLLNKYNVVEYHLLIITRAFEDQETWLTLADFEALARCLAEVDGLAFYNAGKVAGASQRHKHLQLVPLPMMGELPTVPIEIAVNAATFSDGIGRSTILPFEHAIATLPPMPNLEGHHLLELYKKLLKTLSIDDPREQWIGPQTSAYNLLGTRNWLMVVPREQESYQSISVNALGFAGSLLVKNAEKLDLLKAIGPMSLLQKVAK